MKGGDMALTKCKECGHDVSTSAKTCPNCGAPRVKKTGTLLVLFLILVLVFVGLILLGCASRSVERYGNLQTESSDRTKTARVERELEQKIQELLTTGAVHSVNVEFNQVRIDPLLWNPLPLESKQGIVFLFSRYFEVKGSTGRVEVLSNRNDQKLATYSVWSGIKILQ